MKKTTIFERVLSLLLAVFLVFGMLPADALAEEWNEPNTEVGSAVEDESPGSEDEDVPSLPSEPENAEVPSEPVETEPAAGGTVIGGLIRGQGGQIEKCRFTPK